MKSFDIDLLGESLQNNTKINFSQLFGSSRDGLIISESADIDIGIHLSVEPADEIVNEITDSCRKTCQYDKIDLVVLNTANPILAFEALYGKNISCRDEELFNTFYSQTCRSYENEMIRIEKFFSYLDL